MDTVKTQTKSETENIDSTIEKIEDHVKKESTTGVTTLINTWIKKVGEMDELKSIGSDLEKLQEALTAKDGKKIVSIMTKLGEETTKAAEVAEGGEATKIKNLGKALTTAAKAISKFA